MKSDIQGVNPRIQEKYKELVDALGRLDRVALAFSGGVDSCLLLAAVKAAKIPKFLAVTVVSQFFTREEKVRAKEMAEDLGVDHLFLEMDILARPRVVENGKRRCYHCKQAVFSAIQAAAAGRGIDCLIHGINTDDLGDYRPGIDAARELGAQAPLVEAGFSKEEIRVCAKALGLATWNLPSQSCLATRIPTGIALTSRTLLMVEGAERVLHGEGFTQVRVRVHGDLARIEIPVEDMHRFDDEAFREKVAGAVKQLGFSFVALDLEGYATGRMNRVRVNTDGN